MADRKSRRPPMVEVVRRPAPATPIPTPAPAPTPSPPPAATPAGTPTAVRPTGAGPRPARPPPRPGGPPHGRPAARGPATPPTPEAINALAARERVPARIAKGELEGKMRARVWRKLHAEEAKRFDQAYTLMGQHAGLDLAEAFGLLQSGLTLEQFRARQARTRAKATVKEARSAVSAARVDGWLAEAAAAKVPLAFVLADRTLLDVLLSTHPVAFVLERSGRVEKLAVCALAQRGTWDVLLPRLPRDARLAQKPVPVAREPDRRPHSDPRPFLPAVGQRVRLVLRNGFTLEDTLLSVGPYDLLLGAEGTEVLVPLHALLSWEALAEESAPAS
ncbi:MAG TPA: hypothetical protein VMT11_19830 [Myxococcaceae bacterium]|nr:hypothetical protein [Myxococcaceae bacterium]